MKCNTEVHTKESFISTLTPLAAVEVDVAHTVLVQPKLAVAVDVYSDVLANEVPLDCGA